MQSSTARVSAPQRIISLLPGATEMLVALGSIDQLVGISHECDYPASVLQLPRVTTTPIDPSQSSAEIHQAVQGSVAEGRSVIGIDATALRFLRPDMIVTQVLCDVCAVADGEAIRLAQAMSPVPEVIALAGRTLKGVWDDIRMLGTAIGRPREGELLAEELTSAVAEIAREHFTATPKRVLAIEWLDPLFLAGHWVPEMIAAAGGVDVGAAPGSHSVIHGWSDVMSLDPGIVFVILCGFGEARARAELGAFANAEAKAWLATKQVIVLDGNAYTSRPGPRLVDGVKLMGAAMGQTSG